MIIGLAFVPPEETLEYFVALRSVMDTDGKKVCDWFNKIYVSGGRKKPTPQYSPEFWSIHDAIPLNLPRTQNSVEGWHHRLQVLIDKAHVGVYIITELSKEAVIVKNQAENMKSGETIAPNKKNIEKEKRIKIVIAQKNELEIVAFLKKVARNVKLS